MEKKQTNITREKLIKKEDAYFNRFKKRNRVFMMLNVLDDDIINFDYNRSYEYFFQTIPFLYLVMSLNSVDQNDIYHRLQHTRTLIRNLICQKKKNQLGDNYKILIKFLGKIELLSLNLCEYVDENYTENKFELLHYLIFSIKNLSVIRDILPKIPYQINTMNESYQQLLDEVASKYLNSVLTHVQSAQNNYLDDVLYYDNILKLLINYQKKHLGYKDYRRLDYAFESTMIGFKNQVTNKERFSYFINKWRKFFQHQILEKDIYVSDKTSLNELYYQYIIEPNFSYGVFQEAEYIRQIHCRTKEIDNLTVVYTVDGETAEELDDAFSCTKKHELYHLGIHIANPMYYINPQSLLFEEATKRASSLYFNDTTIPMYPDVLSKDLFSLNQGTIRNVISLYVDIDLINQQIVKYDVVLEPVYIQKNDRYPRCSQILKTQKEELDYLNTLNNIQDLMPFLTKFYQMDAVYASINRNKKNISSTNIIGTTKSERMIETLMIFFNFMMSKIALEKQIPYLYRNHSLNVFYQEELEKYRSLIEKEKNNKAYLHEIAILQGMYPKIYYGIDNLGHYGLGLSSYGHLSSPIRRAPDNYNIYMFQQFYFQEQNDFYRDDWLQKLKEVSEYINQRNKSLTRFTQEMSLTLKK